MSDSPGFFRVLFTVLSAFIGIRRSSDHEAVASKIKPWQIIAAALFLVLCLVVSLLLFVRSIVH